jgi:tetratricopeptide (TPR) repeat protein
MKKMKLKYYLFVAIAFLNGFALTAQNPKKFVREGNKNFEQGKYQDAEVEFRKALSANPDYDKAKFNLGDAMYEQKNLEESAKLFKELAETAKSAKLKSDAWYNLGNTMMSQKKYKEAMQAYKNSLLINPDNKDAKYNYEYARKKMIQQQKQQQQQKNQQNKNNKDNKDKNKQNQDQKNKQDKQNKDKQQKDKNKQEQQKQNKEKEQQNKNEQNKQGEEQKQQQQKQQPQQISKKDAQRMLDALKNDEKKTMQKLQKKKAKAAHAKKSDIDW